MNRVQALFRSRPAALVRSALGVAVLVASAAALLPARLGGRTMFVVVQGRSMEPTFHSGDLLFTRRTNAFSVGDVAVYRVPDGEGGAGHLIVHRLQRPLDVASASGDIRWEIKGDSRQTPDATQPTTRQLLARPVVNLGPWATRAVIVLPFLLVLVVGLIVGWLLWPDEPDDTEDSADERDYDEDDRAHAPRPRGKDESPLDGDAPPSPAAPPSHRVPPGPAAVDDERVPVLV